MTQFGLQKLTLLDYPGKVACTVFASGCNLRCPFCHNAPLVLGGAEDCMTENDILAYLGKRRGILDGVCVSGGEPLLSPDIFNFLARVKELGFSVKLDTNGTFPLRLEDAVSRGLADYVAMDVKTAPARYAEAVGINGFDPSPVKESIAFLLSGAVDYEFRTTVVRELHTMPVLVETARSIAGAKRYYLQKFVDSGNLIGDGLTACSDEEMSDFLAAVAPYVQLSELRGI